MPRAHHDHSRAGHLNLRVQHVRAEVWAVCLHDVDLIAQVRRRFILASFWELPAEEGEEDEGVAGAFMRAQVQEETGVRGKHVEG